ncbi:hypothetical protein F5B21DRAFT_430373 [Xylaria acuta]|nr:hypothetical protein F5B21DRAFT_430373 [Xylaria acuta]
MAEEDKIADKKEDRKGERNGDKNADKNAEKNASLWISGLSLGVTYATLLRGIRKVGRVKQTHINGPNVRNPDTCAAKITFFTHEAAQKLLDQAEKGEFLVDGIAPRVVWNKHARAEEPVKGRSRVLRIRGPPEIVNRAYLEWFWAQNFYWDTDRVSDCGFTLDDGMYIIWYYFASWGGQASTARDLLLKSFGNLVEVTYGRDTCGGG